MKKYIILLIVHLISFHAYSQLKDEVQIPQVISKSPEVKALERFGEYPVSEYTGVPHISIPIYNVKIKDYNMPISLDYHAGGIKVTDEATWAGLGWSLKIGATISQVAIGGIENDMYQNYKADDWNSFVDKMVSAGGHPRRFMYNFKHKHGIPVGSDYNYDDILNYALNGSGERDVYQVNLMGGKTFQFSIHPTTGVCITKGENHKCKVVKNGQKWSKLENYR